ncbi:hypothetical protein E3N88_16319 [Mikania micrantha]|uniref:Uncharacterized protein n=1 Tax=Mikania micrantha TaxID=192012 RepID=A0A5N6NY50_9ASTR|nr:hypothetical protein E3N88_16319 [Mikania micrantha]
MDHYLIGRIKQQSELVYTFSGFKDAIWWLQDGVLMVYVCVFSSGNGAEARRRRNNSSCMKSDEIDQIIAPPHSSRTATRCPKSLRVPRRNPEISDFFPASRTAEEVQLLHHGKSISPFVPDEDEPPSPFDIDDPRRDNQILALRNKSIHESLKADLVEHIERVRTDIVGGRVFSGVTIVGVKGFSGVMTWQEISVGKGFQWGDHCG